MQNTYDQQIEQLTQSIEQFRNCQELDIKGTLMNTCYKQLNALLELIKSQDKHINHTKVFKQKLLLEKTHKEYLQQIDFYMMAQDASQLQTIYSDPRARKQSINHLIKNIEQAKNQIDRSKLNHKEKKIFDDAQVLMEDIQNNQKTSQQNSFYDQQILQEINDPHNDQEELMYIVKETGSLNRISQQISQELFKQQQETDLLSNRVGMVNQNLDQAEDDFIQAHSLEMQTRRNEIRALFTAIFAFLGYFKGFGMWLGGALGIVTGDAVAKISQSGLEDKVKKDEDNDKENK